jgi:hypothetical protein
MCTGMPVVHANNEACERGPATGLPHKAARGWPAPSATLLPVASDVTCASPRGGAHPSRRSVRVPGSPACGGARCQRPKGPSAAGLATWRSCPPPTQAPAETRAMAGLAPSQAAGRARRGRWRLQWPPGARNPPRAGLARPVGAMSRYSKNSAASSHPATPSVGGSYAPPLPRAQLRSRLGSRTRKSRPRRGERSWSWTRDPPAQLRQ